MEIKKIRRSAYNPRKLNKDSKKALKTSINEFGDISGITVNKRNGNLISGNHRWTELVDEYGKGNLFLEHLEGEIYGLNVKTGLEEEAGFTGFTVRVVDWDDPKEKAANITANSDLVAGEFTAELQDVLADAAIDMPEKLFIDLRLEELQIDFEDDYLDLDDNSDTIQEQAEQKNRELEEAKGEESEPVTEIRSLIKISTPSELKDEVKADLLEFLAKKKYYDEITIV